MIRFFSRATSAWSRTIFALFLDDVSPPMRAISRLRRLESFLARILAPRRPAAAK